VSVCTTGTDGFVPYYDPTGDVYKEGPQYGCLQAGPKIKHRFLVLVSHQFILSPASHGATNQSRPLSTCLNLITLKWEWTCTLSKINVTGI